MARISAKVDRTILQKTQQFITALQNDGLRIQRAYLYGSQAKGTARQWSDIDVAIVAENLSGDWHDDLIRLNLLASHIDSRIEAVGYVPKTFCDESPLVWEIKTSGIPLMRNGKRRANTRRKSRAIKRA